MAKIRNPAAFAAWLARKQMAQQQEQNVQKAEQQGVPAVVSQPEAIQAILQQAAMQAAMSKQVKKRDMPLGVYGELFEGETPIGGFNKRKAAYQDLNLGFGGKNQ
jgi:hypothetical protein